MSRPTPAAFDSAMSMMTTSASSFSAIWRATVAPTLPAPPTTVTLRFMNLLLLLGGPEGPALRSQRPTFRSAYRTRGTGYSQFLLQTLLKRSGCAQDRRTIPSNLAVCTIVVRRLSASRRLYLPSSTRRDAASRIPALKIVVADDLPPSAVDLLRAEGWSVDARPSRTP